MKQVEPRVFLIGKSTPDLVKIREWLTCIGADEYRISDQVTAGEQLVQLAGKRCYMSFQLGLNPNITRIRADMSDFIDNILKVGHGSVLEHAVYNFALENVSRVFTAEMNRHRAGVAISEGSMRYIRFDDIPFWMPAMIQFHASDTEELTRKKAATQDAFRDVFYHVEKVYGDLLTLWKDELAPDSPFKQKKQLTSMLRRIIPMGVASGGVWSLNLRALRHVFHMRCAAEAEDEMIIVASMMLERMMEAEPLFFKDFYKDEKGFWRAGHVKV